MKEVYESRAANVTHKKAVNDTTKWIGQRELEEQEKRLKWEEEQDQQKRMTQAMVSLNFTSRPLKLIKAMFQDRQERKKE